MRVAVKTTPDNELDELVIQDCPHISMEMMTNKLLLIKIGNDETGTYHLHARVDGGKLKYLLTRETEGWNGSSSS